MIFRWKFSCVDMNALVETTWAYRSHVAGSKLMIDRIRLFREEGQDFYVDNLYIGNGIPQCECSSSTPPDTPESCPSTCIRLWFLF